MFSGYYFYWDSSNNTWNDAAAGDGQADPVSFSYSATPVVNGTIITGIGGQGADFIFTMSGIVASSTPTYPSTFGVEGGAFGQVQYVLQQHLRPMKYYIGRNDTAGTTAIYYKVSESNGTTVHQADNLQRFPLTMELHQTLRQLYQREIV